LAALVAAGYVLGSVRAPAQADDSDKLVDLFTSIELSGRAIADATTAMAQASEK
jgi:hypothetical protein